MRPNNNSNTQREGERQQSTQRDERSADLNDFERVAHHGNEHVDEDDDRRDVVERKEEHSDRLHDALRPSPRRSSRAFHLETRARSDSREPCSGT